MVLKGVSKVRNDGPRAPFDPEAARRFEFAEAIEGNRDQWGRPKVMLPDGSKEVGYRRASSYGAPLEDASALERWKLRQVARGISRRGDLQLAVTRAELGLDGDFAEAKKSKRELDELANRAMDVVESGAAASVGTSLHQVFEMVDLGKDPGHVAEQWKPDLAAYRELTRGFRVLGTERFVVQDDHRVAGTLDRAVEVLHDTEAPDGTLIEAGSVVIGDVKTAQSMDFAGSKFGIQCWVYATGHPYNPITKLREPWDHVLPREDWAVIFHVASGSGRAGLYWVDLKAAAEAADVARDCYEWRNRRGKRLITAAEENFAATAALAGSVDELMAAHKRAVALGVWTDAIKVRFATRRKELEAA